MAILALIALQLQFTPERWLLMDLLWRGAFPVEHWFRYAFADPSGHAIAAPADRFIQQSLRSLELPWWDRTSGGGVDFAVQGQGGPYFPLRLLTLPLPSDQLMSVHGVISLLVGYLGTFRLSRSLQFTPASAVWAGLTFVTGSVCLYLVQLNSFLTLMFLPWLMWLDTEGERELPGWKGGLTFAVVVCLFCLSGHVMLIAVVGLACGLWHLLHFRPQRSSVWSSVRFAIAWSLGCLLSAFHLLPTAIRIASSWSYKTDSSGRPSWEALPDWNMWWQFIQATVVDRASALSLLDDPAFLLYLGPTLVLSAIVAVAVRPREQKTWRLTAFTLTFLVLAIPPPPLLALGEAPIIGHIRNIYLLPVAVLGLSLMGASGLDALLARLRAGSAQKVVLIALIAVGPCFLVSRQMSIVPVTEAFLPESPPAIQFLHNADTSPRLVAGQGNLTASGWGVVTGVEDIRTMTALHDRRYVEWWQLADPTVWQRNYPTFPTVRSPESPLFGDFSVRWFAESRLPNHYFLSAIQDGDPLAPWPPTLAADSLPVRYEDAVVRIREIPAVQPVVRIPAEVVTVAPDPRAAIAELKQRLREQALVPVIESAAPVVAGAGTIVSWQGAGRSFDIDVEMSEAGVVIVNERFAPGWHAFIDGQPAPILPANLIARAVEVPAGRHNIQMRYTPPGWSTGLLVSGCTLLLLLALTLGGRRLAAARSEA